MTWRSDSTSLVSGAWVSSAYAGHGVAGADVPSAGTHGPALLFQHLSLPTDAANEFRWVPSTVPGSGTLALGEDSAYTLTGAADGVHNLNGTWFRNGVSQGSSTNTITIGNTATGTVVLTESGQDAASAVGTVLVQGVASVAESSGDVASLVGGTVWPAILGNVAAAETGSDSATLQGRIPVVGAITLQEIGSDTAVILGDGLISGDITAFESGADTAMVVGASSSFSTEPSAYRSRVRAAIRRSTV